MSREEGEKYGAQSENRSRAAAEEKAKAFGIARVMTIDEIAASDEIELVVNLTPAYAHYEIIRKMLLTGKHVWTEKTMTVELEQAMAHPREQCDLRIAAV